MLWEDPAHRRYRQVSDLVTNVLTLEAQRRLQATMEDAYSKAIAAGATQEQISGSLGAMGDKAHAYAAVENAKRIGQWTEAILETETDWMRAHPARDPLRWLGLGALVGAALALALTKR
jgi:hypothetical protein